MLKRGNIILLFILSLSVAIGLTWFNYRNIDSLSKAITQLQKPDNRIARLKQLILNVNTAESYVRSFAITRNKKFLSNYDIIVQSVDSDVTSLKTSFSDSQTEIDTIVKLIDRKFEVYNKLIDLRYKQLINDAVGKISDKVQGYDAEFRHDSTDEKMNVFKRLFGSAKRIRELERKVFVLDSLNSLQSAKLRGIKEAVIDAQGNELLLITELSESELNLLSVDRQLKSQLQYQLGFLETKILRNHARKSAEVVRDATQQMRTMMVLTILSSLVIIVLTIIILLDISRTNRYKKEIEISRNNAVKLAKFKEDFLATMSHEIRTPLSALTGFSQKLLQTNTTAEQKQYIRTINLAGDHLLNIVNDVLDLSRIETGKLQLNSDPFSIHEAVKDVHNLMSLKAAEKNINFTMDASVVKTDVVKGDVLRLKQILLNVCGNAIKFTSKGSVHIHVKYDNGYNFTIADTGVGIPEDKLAEIFNPYEQANNIEKNYGGTGLGLAITKKIVVLLNGTISISSKQGKGTTISIVIPYEKTSEKISSASMYEQKTEANLSGYKILLAEDDALNHELAVATLKTAGAEIVSAANGKEAIEKLLLQNADVVLMDIQMPELNGRQATIFIREHISKTIPIIGITANVMNDARNECVEAGMNDVLLKPFDIDNVMSVVSPLLDNHLEARSKKGNILEYSLDSLFKTSNGKSDFVIKMLKIFLSSNSKLLEKTIAQTGDGHYDQAAASIHRLIPSFRQLGMDDFANIFKNIEWLLLNASEKTAINGLLNTCKQHFDQLEKTLNADIERLENDN